MEIRRIKIGNKYLVDDVLHTVVGFQNGVIVMVETESTSLEFYTIKYDDLMEKMNSFEIKEAESKQNEDNMAFSALSGTKKEKYEIRLAFIKEVEKEFGPSFIELGKKNRKELFETCEEKYGFTKKSAWQLVRKYLQSGLNPYSLISKSGNFDHSERNIVNKLGRKSSLYPAGIPLTNEVKEIFDEGIKDYLGGKANTIKAAYKNLIYKHYTYLKEEENEIVRDLLPSNQRPTYYQFYNYLNKMVDKDEIEKAKTSAAEQRNNSRLLLSDNLKDVDGPGSLAEVDECEVDVFLVSNEDRRKVIGRPIVYGLIDVYSRAIIAVSVSLENNSYKGITNCLLNLIEDKKELCKKYNIAISNSVWVDHFLPNRIRSDYGSEYISYEFERVCNEFGIQREVASPGTGSMKGQIEQLFHQMHSGQNAVLENHGLISKRHDSNHKTTAVLTIEEFKGFVYAMVVAHNSKYMKNYPLTADMRKKKVKSIPSELWEYGISKYGMPKPILNDLQFKYALLKDITASISRDGITYKGLKYINLKDESLISMMTKIGKKKVKFDCRIDERCVDYLYYENNGFIKRVDLNLEKTGMEDYLGLTWFEYNQILEDKKKLDHEGYENNLKIDIALTEKQRKILSTAKTKSVELDNRTPLTENRKQEKLNIEKNETIMRNESNNTLPLIENNNVASTKNNNSDEAHEITLEEALESIKETESELYG